MASRGCTLLGTLACYFSITLWLMFLFDLTYDCMICAVCRDVGYESYKAHRRGPSPLEAAHFSEPTRIGLVAIKRAVFQSVASMYVTVHHPSRVNSAHTHIAPSAIGPSRHSRSTPPSSNQRSSSCTPRIPASSDGHRRSRGSRSCPSCLTSSISPSSMRRTWRLSGSRSGSSR